MTRRIHRFARTIALAVFLPSFVILLSLSGTVFADVLARAAGEQAAESIAPGPPRVDNVPQERLERWRAMPPEERERIRERYRRWKELTPEKRERIMERHRRWRELPEERRRYLKDRRELLKDAVPEDRAVVRKFFDRMRSLPPGARSAARQKIWEWCSLPPGEREEAMRSWPFYRGLSDRERDSLRWFLFARPGERYERGGPPPRE
ncbi:MAG: DUF3106 domain-containing protein [Candidatus Deferrimicrobium sp.]|nr:DUF3106 domain-containing protein [Candidatus Deferrimicrobium sp.]